MDLSSFGIIEIEFGQSLGCTNKMNLIKVEFELVEHYFFTRLHWWSLKKMADIESCRKWSNKKNVTNSKKIKGFTVEESKKEVG